MKTCLIPSLASFAIVAIPSASAQDKPADTICLNGKIYTLDE